MDRKDRMQDRARRTRTRRMRHRVLYLILCIIVLLLLTVLIVNVVKRLQEPSTQLVENLGVTVDEEGGNMGELAVDSALGTQFSAYQNGIALLTGDEFRIYSSAGKQEFYRQVSMSHPVLKTGGRVNLIFDRGGTSYFVVNNRKETLNKTLSLPIINAEVNNNGWGALIAQESGYKSAVTVLNPQQEETYYAYFAKSYVTCAAISEDGKYMAAGGLQQEEGAFLSRISLYDLSEPEPVQQLNLTDVTVLDLKFLSSGQLVVLTDEGMLLYRREGGELIKQEEASFGSDYCRAYSLDGGNFACAVVSRFKVGGQGRLMLLDGNSNAQPLTIEEQVVSISASGTYIAVLTATDVQIYNKKLELVKSESQLTDVRHVLMRSDGTALLVSTNSVRVLR